MPVYNEEEVIGPVLDKWHAALTNVGIDFEIRPYNDGSKDGSLAIMQESAQRLGPRIQVRDKPNGGHGNTILTGYRKASEDGFDWIFQVDSDDEIGPEQFGEFWKRRSDKDFLVGIRQDGHRSFSRRLLSGLSRLCVMGFYGKGIRDVNCPFRLMRVAAFKDFYNQLPLNTFAPNVILSGLAARHK
ncbi:MAG: glycosyltransferase family 2 protein, partial [Muribaculaceae bacterium]|nr:glycosyltransferase family 2 protein [Muribaculaceae bacterium]